MNILLVNAAYAPFVGGAEAYAQAIVERLCADGHVVQVVTSDAAEVESFWDPRKPRLASGQSRLGGAAVERIPLAYLPFSPYSFYLMRRAATSLGMLPGSAGCLRALAPCMPRMPGLVRRLRALHGPFDLVHGINIALEWPLIAAWQRAQAARLPFVTTPFVHTGEPRNNRVSRSYSMPHQLEPLRNASAVIAQTAIERDFLVQRGVAPGRIQIHGMGVTLDRVQGGNADAFRASHNIRGPIVLFLGVITRDKGSIHLVEAMRRLWAGGVEATLVIAGKPVAEFESYWQSLPVPVTARILRTGVIVGQAKRDLLAAATMLVLPSRIDSFGAVYLEAWANAMPVIGARAGGVPAVIAEGCDGLLVDYGAVGELAAAIARLLADADLRRSMGLAGRSKVIAHYTWDRIYARLSALYAESIASFPAGHAHA